MTYIYKPGDNKHPYELRVCPSCKDELLIRAGCVFCSVKCGAMARRGRTITWAVKGPEHVQWLGESAKYGAKHHRIYRARGKASAHMCACGKQAQDWANLTGDYDDVYDFEPMCKKCHKAYDMARLVPPPPCWCGKQCATYGALHTHQNACAKAS